MLYITKQIGVNPSELAHYSLGRDTTRREHLLELIPLGGFRSCEATTQKELSEALLPVALSTDSGIKLMEELLAEMRARQIIVPALSSLESLAFEVRAKAQGMVTKSLTRGPTIFRPERYAKALFDLKPLKNDRF